MPVTGAAPPRGPGSGREGALPEQQRWRPRLRRAPSLPEVFPGQNERADRIEIVHEPAATELLEPSAGPSSLDSGTVTLTPSRSDEGDEPPDRS